MKNENITNNVKLVKSFVEKESKLKLGRIKLLSRKILHQNPVYLSKLKNNNLEVVIKFFKDKNLLRKEVFCNDYLTRNGLLVPKIISFSERNQPFIIMQNIGRDIPSETDSNKRIKSLAFIHSVSLNDSNNNLMKVLPKRTKSNRIKNLKKYIKILKTNPLIEKHDFRNIDLLRESILKTNYSLWENCFCFNDFFVNNSIKSDEGIYYFDFEKSVIASPFVDVGCIVINYPQRYEKIKSLYIESITHNIKNKKIEKIHDYVTELNSFVDIGICEKVIEDAAFLSDDSIKKMKSNSFCKKLAKKKLESVSFVFDNLKKPVGD